MRIIYTSQVFNEQKTSGLGKYALNLINGIVANHPEHELVCFINAFNARSLIKPQFANNSVRIMVNRIPNTVFNWPVFQGFNGFPLDFFTGKFDILHALHLPISMPMHFSGKSIITIHDLTLTLFPKLHTKENVNKYNKNLSVIVSHADALIADSYATKKDIIDHLRFPEKKIYVIHLAVESSFQPVYDEEKKQAVRKKYGIPEKYIYFLGNLEPRKNIPALIKAYDWLLKTKRYKDIHLVIGGKKGWLYDEIFTLVTALSLEKQIHFIGYVDDADRPVLYSGAAVVVYPSLYEGFGLPVLEALACGASVVTSNTSSMPEVAGDAALLIDPKNIEEIAKAIERILTQDTLCVALRQKAIKQAAKFSIPKMAAETLAVYNAVKIQ